MSTFHAFPQLPLELREHIWKSTVEPRTVNIHIDRENLERRRHLTSSTPIPAVLHTCREARNQGLYQQARFEVDTHPSSEHRSPTPSSAMLQSREVPDQGLSKSAHFSVGTPRSSERRTSTPNLAVSQHRDQAVHQQTRFDSEWRYVWLNWDIDMVDIGTSEFRYFEPVATQIKRLKFERENGDEFFYNTEKSELMKFVNVEEIHVDCADGFWMWGEAVYDHPWPCGPENVVFIDSTDGRVARGLELETVYRQMLKDARFAATGEAYSSDEDVDD
jgi:hypothetical protein